MEGFSVIDFSKGGSSPMSRVVAAALAASMFAGCAKVQEAINSVSTRIKPNIVGKVTAATSAPMRKISALGAESGKTVPVFGRKLPVVSHAVSGDPVGNCTVTARDLETGQSIASGTSGTDGQFVIQSDLITAGKSYRIVAECAGNKKFAAVASADTQSPAAKNPIATNARSTLIAAQIVQAVLQAVESATNGISNDAVRARIKQAVLQAVDTIIAQVAAVIEDAIDSGAMQEPSDAVASNMTGSVDDATTLSEVQNAQTEYENNVGTIPESVGNATVGAARAVSALPMCDSAIATGTDAEKQAGCTKAVAKLLYSLGFSVAVNIGSGGSFESSGSCSSSDTELQNAFPGAEFKDLGTAPGDGEDRPQIAGACFVRSKTAKVNRNEGYDDRGEGEDDTIFVETFSSPPITGLLSRIAQSMLANYQYSLNNIDQIVFEHEPGAQAGMNMKLVFQSKEFDQGSGGFGPSYKYRDSSGNWQDIACTQGSCPLWEIIEQGFDDMTWGSCKATGAAKTLATNIGAGDFVGNVMSPQYSGPVPTQTQMESFFNERTFVDNNPSGEKEFNVVFGKDPRWVNPGDNLPAPAAGADPRPVACKDSDDSTPCPNGCFDNDPSTTCYAVGSSIEEATPVRVNVAISPTKVASGDYKGFTAITTITPDSSGAFFLRPIFGPRGFVGAGQLISASTGRLLRDDFMRPRTFFVYDTGMTCPSGLSCSPGHAYNVDLEWSCGGNGPCETTLQGITGALNSIDITGLNAEVKTEYRSRWEEIHAGSDHFGHSVVVVGRGDWNDLDVLTMGFNPSSVPAISSPGKASSLSDIGDGRYAVSPVWDCDNNGCQVGGFYLVNENGIPYSDPSQTNTVKWGQGKVCWAESGSWTCGTNVIRFGVGVSANWLNLDSGAPDYDSENDGTQNFDSVAGSIRISSGPALNPSHKCSFDPYYIETGTANGQLDCDVDDVAATNGDVSFSNMWEFDRWMQDPAHQSQQVELKRNANGYRFSNPAAVKNLMNTAFPGWFDGSHTIDSSTRFNALQVFSLIYLFFEGNGNDGLHVEGLAPEGQHGGFMSLSPVMSGNNKVPSFNKAFGNGLITFKQATN
jgi:hypothetical protein